jgi:TatD DNase family protein
VVWLTDTHCHLNLNIFQDDLPAVLERARQQGVSRILVPGIDIETSRLALELCERHDLLFAAVGIHPHDAASWTDGTLASLRQMAGHPKVAAIGEIGLDYYRDRSPRPQQRQVLRAQLEMAAELNLPVVLHNREAIDDLWSEISGWLNQLTAAASPLVERPGVLHSYDGDLPTTQKAVEQGFRIGISGPVTFKNAPLRHQVASGLPLDRLMLETDAPYLTPHPYRGRRNEPAYVALVAEKLASLHDVPLETVWQSTWKNAEELFHWGASL